MVTSRRTVRRTTRTAAAARRTTPIRDDLPDPPSDPIPPITPIESPDSIHSPLYLTNGDNPGLSIISETLDGSNYDDWRIAMTIALDAKNKLVFIDGSYTRPLESHRSFRIWSRCNSMVKSWILNFVSKQIYNSILRFNDAYEIWKELMARFHITNLPRSYQLTQQIWSLQQGSMDLATYYTTLKTYWNELDGANCEELCHNCDCCKAMNTKAEHARVIKFLAGLNESYATIRSQIIMKKHVPDLAEIYNLLDQDHNQRSITPVQNAYAFNISVVGSDHLSASMNATRVSYNNSKQTRPTCSHCGYSGHTMDKCYKLHGYPPGFKPKQKFQPEQNMHNGQIKPMVAQIAVTESVSNDVVANMTNCLSKDQIQGVIAYFNSQLQTSTDDHVSVTSTSGATITALPGSYQGVDDWSR